MIESRDILKMYAFLQNKKEKAKGTYINDVRYFGIIFNPPTPPNVPSASAIPDVTKCIITK